MERNGTLLYTSGANTVYNEPTSSKIPHILIYIVQILALWSPNFVARRFLFSGILLALYIETLRNLHFTNDLGSAQPFCIQWSFLIATFEKLLLSGDEGPEAHFWRHDHGEKEALTYSAFSFKKFEWAFMLLLNQRGVGWNHQVRNIPEARLQKKSQFLKERAGQFASRFLMADLMFQLGIHLFYTNHGNGVVGDVNTKYISLAYGNPVWNFAAILVFAATPYFALSAQYTLFSLIFVTLNIGTPQVILRAVLSGTHD
jgi:hypothetical protein